MKAGEAELAQEWEAAEATGPGKDGADQAVFKSSGEEGTTVVGEEGRAALPLVLVPFDAVPEEEPQAQSKQATKAKWLQAVVVAQDVLRTTPGRLGQIEEQDERQVARGRATHKKRRVTSLSSMYRNGPT